MAYVSLEGFIRTYFPNAKRDSNGYKVHCPCRGHKHNDKTESLHISEGADGTILMNCKAGHTFSEICSALGVEESDMFPPDHSKYRKEAYSDSQCRKASVPAVNKWKPPYRYPTYDSAVEGYIQYINRENGTKFQYVARYEYPDGSFKVRYEDTSGKEKKKTFAWICLYEGKWIAKQPPDRKHNLFVEGNYEMEDSGYIKIRDMRIFLVEGEKDVITLYEKLEGVFTAVTGENGAGFWKQEYVDQLAGHTVYFIPDNDDTGNANIALVLKMTADKAKIYIVQLQDVWPEIPDKGDVTDMFEILGDEEAEKRLMRAMDEAEKRGPVAVPTDELAPAPASGPTLEAAPEPILKSSEKRTNFPVELNYGEYLVSDSGVYIQRPIKSNTTLETVYTIPVIIIGRYRNIETHEERTKLWYREKINGHIIDNEFVVANEDLLTARNVTKLSRFGIPISSSRANIAVDYHLKLLELNADQIPIMMTTSHMGRYDDNIAHFIPYADDVSIDEYGDFPDLCKAICEKGDFDEWLENVLKCVHFDPKTKKTVSESARFALAASFASPIVGLIGLLNFFVDLWGPTGSGKTVSAMIAASVWGDPEEGGGYVMRLDNTRAACEAAANFLRNIPLILDESQLIPRKKDGTFAWDPVYYLAEGASKGRSNVNLGLRKSGKWKMVIISTGERPLADSEAEGGKKNRIVEIECFPKSFLHDNGGSIAGAIKLNYGSAGRRWIEIISRSGVLDEITELYMTTVETLMHSGITNKQAENGAILLAAYNIADKYLLHSNNPIAVSDLMNYLKTDEEVDTYEYVHERFMSYLTAHGCDIIDKTKGEKLNKDDKPFIGVRKKGPDSEHDCIDVLDDSFKKICRQIGEISVDAYVKWLNENGKIITDKKGLYRFPHINGANVKCVELIVEARDSDSGDI